MEIHDSRPVDYRWHTMMMNVKYQCEVNVNVKYQCEVNVNVKYQCEVNVNVNVKYQYLCRQVD